MEVSFTTRVGHFHRAQCIEETQAPAGPTWARGPGEQRHDLHHLALTRLHQGQQRPSRFDVLGHHLTHESYHRLPSKFVEAGGTSPTADTPNHSDDAPLGRRHSGTQTPAISDACRTRGNLESWRMSGSSVQVGHVSWFMFVEEKRTGTAEASGRGTCDDMRGPKRNGASPLPCQLNLRDQRMHTLQDAHK